MRCSSCEMDLEDKTEYTVCCVCESSGCVHCTTSVPDNVCSPYFAKYLVEKYGDILAWNPPKDICYECFDKEKTLCIESIPKDKLPLYINEKWDDEDLQKMYAKRLQEGV